MWASDGGPLIAKVRYVHVFFEAFSGHDRYIADCLIEKVLLQVQFEKVRNFLLKISILERMSDSLPTALPTFYVNGWYPPSLLRESPSSTVQPATGAKVQEMFFRPSVMPGEFPNSERVTRLLDQHVVFFFYQNVIPQLITLARPLPLETRTLYTWWNRGLQSMRVWVPSCG